MARPRKFKPQQVVDALRKAHGLKSLAGELLGCSHDAIDDYCKRYPECQEVINHWGRRRKDSAEFKLDAAIAKGEPWAVMFTLKNAPDRDYSGKPQPAAPPNWRDDARRLGIDPDTFLVAVNRVLVELAATNAGDSVKSAAVES